ncbi:hypothetical protein N7462_003737 [Penicillium macrosclerotiorum]|uniref:uncharacterized protein n=1 Tax=Penicillium macrosclerotiorum TaxID=303699 RepID=UPI0025467B5B|nr:uncharacterized protein N7462_003737 [Penicillium macrosclerotiorum]KAJ5689345.1 hypothetical protein N7462_003737 [Penicillium macrosclerotiorum]
MTRVTQLEANFPDCEKIEQGKGPRSEVLVIGAGWNFLSFMTAIVAAGATVIAYERDRNRAGRGPTGSTRINEPFELGQLSQAVQLLPNLTEKQLTKLPPVITKIKNHERYQDLLKKVAFAKDFRSKKEALYKSQGIKMPFLKVVEDYKNLPISNKITRGDLIKVKDSLVDLLVKEGLVKMNYQEVKIDLVKSWLGTNRPCFMIPGEQVNLQKLGMKHLEGSAGLVPEFIGGSDEVKQSLAMIKTAQGNRHTPSVALVGGGASAMACGLELLEEVGSKPLGVVWIRPEENILMADRSDSVKQSLRYRAIDGHISALVPHKENQMKNKIEYVGVTHLGSKNKRTREPCDLLIHCPDERISYSQKEDGTLQSAFESINEDAKKYSNVLTRNASFYPMGLEHEIMLRLRKGEKFDVKTLKDDELVNYVEELKKRSDPTQATIVISGVNNYTRRAMWALKELGFKGHVLQVAIPSRDARVTSEEEKLKNKVEECKRHGLNWISVRGRLGADGTSLVNGKFQLGVKDSKNKTVPVPPVDVVINGAGKTKITPLVNAMKQENYIRETSSKQLVSNHEKLYGTKGFFVEADATQGSVDLSTSTINSWPGVIRLIDPSGWEDTFWATRRVLGTKGK